MNVETLTQILSDISTEVTQPISPWQMKNVINRHFKTNLPGQMFYNYVSKKFIEAEKNGEGKWMVQPEEVVRFAKKYATRNLLNI